MEGVATRVDSRARMWLLATAFAAASFLAGAVLAPLAAGRLGGAGSLLRLLYRPVCHQIPSRCFDLGWGPLAVCARCTGLYLGATAALFAAVITARTFRPRWPWLVAAAAPSVIDFGFGFVGLPSLGNWPRFALALPFGALCGVYLADAIADIASRDRSRNPLQ